MKESKDDRVKQLKQCAEEIIERAEELIGDNTYSMGYVVSIELFPQKLPTIKLERIIYPRKVVED